MKLLFTITLWLILSACPKPVTRVGPPAPPKPTEPLFEKTFGDIRYEGQGALHLQYKSISIGINSPSFFQNSNDYLLLTDIESRHWSYDWVKSPRMNMKILAPPPGIKLLHEKGFSQAKGLSHGQRMLLKKESDFLFVSAVQSRDSKTSNAVNGYLLEFDNGRNIFIGIGIQDEAAIRELVYSLRDDGKELELGFVSGDNENQIALFLALLQPRIGVVVDLDETKKNLFDVGVFQVYLTEQLFSGQFLIPKTGDLIPF